MNVCLDLTGKCQRFWMLNQLSDPVSKYHNYVNIWSRMASLPEQTRQSCPNSDKPPIIGDATTIPSHFQTSNQVPMSPVTVYSQNQFSLTPECWSYSRPTDQLQNPVIIIPPMNPKPYPHPLIFPTTNRALDHPIALLTFQSCIWPPIGFPKENPAPNLQTLYQWSKHVLNTSVLHLITHEIPKPWFRSPWCWRHCCPLYTIAPTQIQEAPEPSASCGHWYLLLWPGLYPSRNSFTKWNTQSSFNHTSCLGLEICRNFQQKDHSQKSC